MTVKTNQTLLFLVVFFMLIACSSEIPIRAKNRPAQWGKAIKSEHNHNFYKIDDRLYRSAQPSHAGMKELERKGIKEILNLRYFHRDDDEMKGTQLVAHRLPMVAHNVTYPELVDALKIIQQAKAPILVHCLHGSDRTGIVVAAYRIAIQNWSKQEAIREMKQGGYGHHGRLFPNLIGLLQDFDIAQLKNDIKE